MEEEGREGKEEEAERYGGRNLKEVRNVKGSEGKGIILERKWDMSVKREGEKEESEGKGRNGDVFKRERMEREGSGGNEHQERKTREGK